MKTFYFICLTLAVLLLCVNDVVSQNPISVSYEKSVNNYVFTANNQSYYPYTVIVIFKDLEGTSNMSEDTLMCIHLCMDSVRYLLYALIKMVIGFNFRILIEH